MQTEFHGPIRPWVALLVASAITFASAVQLSAQQRGTVSGVVTSRETGLPLTSAQVSIPGTGIGALANSAGRYVLPNVPSGPVTVRAELIGYAPVTRTVTVVAGETATVDFGLASQTLALEGIVVTGTPGGTQRKAVGNVVERMDAAARVEVSPARDVEQLIGQQAASVHVVSEAGQVGAGSAVRIRGVSSMALGKVPLLYVDGVRVDNSVSAGPPMRGARQISRMNDFNPDDIASVEIIKGPAAATLYGTEAANGVIHIITKKGVSGAPTFDMSVRQGANWLPDPEGRTYKTYYYNTRTGVTDSMNIHQVVRERGDDPVFTTGRLQNYDVSVRGGTDLVRYYASLGYDDGVGIVDYNWNKSNSQRLNLFLTPGDSWDVSANIGYVRNHTRLATTDATMNIWSAVMWTRPDGCDEVFRCFRYAPPEVIAEVDGRSKYSRFTGSLQFNHRPTSWLTQRATVGLDQGTDLVSQLFPRVPDGATNFFGARGEGQKLVENHHTAYLSLDYGATAAFALRPDLRSSTSAGVQFNQRQTVSTTALGIGFPTTAITSIGGAARTTSSEAWLENKTLGTYIQQQFDWRDRVFVTAALRGDDNSAFGKDFEAAIYPKFSATWVLSDESFWNVPGLDQLRLRTAWGQAGMQPGIFNAVTLFTPTTGSGGGSGITPRSFGDPGLKPEVSEELELGFDASGLGDRLSVELTYYTKKTRDALAAKPLRPSSGFPGSQLVNVGRIDNSGLELTLDARIVERPGFGLGWGLNFATQGNRIVDLGDIVTPRTDGTRNHVGYPVNAFFARTVRRGEFIPGTSTPTNMICDGGTGPYGLDMGGPDVPCAGAPALFWGSAEPKWLGGTNLTVRLGQNLRLGALAEFKGGHNSLDNSGGGTRSLTNTRVVNPIRDPRVPFYLQQGNNNVPAWFNAGFARLREVSMTYNLPQSWVERTGASRASIHTAGRNLAFLWREQMVTWNGPGLSDDGHAFGGSLIFDPETSPGIGDATAVEQGHKIPPVAQFLVTLRFSF